MRCLFPAAIRVDQGTEFVSRDLDLWAYQRGVTLERQIVDGHDGSARRAERQRVLGVHERRADTAQQARQRPGHANLLAACRELDRLGDLAFTIIDTAGLEESAPASLAGRMRAQTEASLVGADVALFVIDSRAGLTPLDEEIGRYLRESSVPVVLIANKAEGKSGDHGVYESFALGLGEPIPFSAEHGTGMADLFEALLPLLEGRPNLVVSRTMSKAFGAARKFPACR